MHFIKSFASSLLLCAAACKLVISAPTAETGPGDITNRDVSPLSLENDPSSNIEKRQGTWSCTVPAGYIYTRVQSTLGTCGSGFHLQYLIQRPASNTWSCTSYAPGFTYDRVQNQLNVCSSGGFALSYHLISPQDNVWSCQPVSGYTYDRVQNQLNVCSSSNFALSYHLRVPVNGLWACQVPPGWGYTATQNQLNVCSSSNFAYSYRLFH